MSLIMMVLVFTFIGNTTPLKRILIKIIAMPLVMGIAYEVFRLPLKYPHNPIVRILTAPGLWLQHLTTKEPDAEQIEVALTALLKVPAFPGATYNDCPPNVISEEELIAETEAEAEAETEAEL
jgi:uncharacterized protein YqhQ